MNAVNLLNKFIEKNEDSRSKKVILEDIFELKFPNESGLEVNTRIPFEKEEKKMILPILIKMIKSFLEEDESDLDNNQIEIKNRQAAPLVVVIEDFQLADKLSYFMTKQSIRHLKKFILILVSRTEYVELRPFQKNNKKADKLEDVIIGEKVGKIEEIANEFGNITCVELNGLDKPGLEKLIYARFGTSNFTIESFVEEPEEPLYFRKSQKGKKLVDKEKKEAAIKQNSFYKKFDFIKFLMEKAEGHPLTVLNFIQNCLQKGIILIKKDTLFLKDEFLKCVEIDEFLTLDSPLCCVQINGPLLDRLDPAQYLLLKACAVIGNCFDYQTLTKVNPFKNIISNDKLLMHLNELANSDFFEILDETEHNIIYRFTLPFMRETIYQRLLYLQRRQFHRFVAEAIQDIPLSHSTANEKIECERLIYHWCLAEDINYFKVQEPEGQGTNDNPVALNFSAKAKRSIIVKKISSILMKNTSTSSNVLLKTGYLEKKSDKGATWARRFCIINTIEFRYYYTEDQYRDNPEESLGQVGLKHVFSIIPLKEGEIRRKHGFVINTGSWTKKNKEMGIREFYFSASSEDELETWTTYLEFLRAKAIYDDFVNTFGKISFPIKNNIEKIEELDYFSSEFMKKKSVYSTSSSDNLLKLNLSMKSISPTKSRIMRKTTFSKLKSHAHMPSESSIQEIKDNTEQVKLLKDRLQRFVKVGNSLFWSLICEKAQKKNMEIICGQNPSFIKKRPDLLNIDKELLEDAEKDKKENKTSIEDKEEFNENKSMKQKDLEMIEEVEERSSIIKDERKSFVQPAASIFKQNNEKILNDSDKEKSNESEEEQPEENQILIEDNIIPHKEKEKNNANPYGFTFENHLTKKVNASEKDDLEKDNFNELKSKSKASFIRENRMSESKNDFKIIEPKKSTIDDDIIWDNFLDKKKSVRNSDVFPQKKSFMENSLEFKNNFKKINSLYTAGATPKKSFLNENKEITEDLKLSSKDSKDFLNTEPKISYELKPKLSSSTGENRTSYLRNSKQSVIYKINEPPEKEKDKEKESNSDGSIGEEDLSFNKINEEKTISKNAPKSSEHTFVVKKPETTKKVEALYYQESVKKPKKVLYAIAKKDGLCENRTGETTVVKTGDVVAIAKIFKQFNKFEGFFKGNYAIFDLEDFTFIENLEETVKEVQKSQIETDFSKEEEEFGYKSSDSNRKIFKTLSEIEREKKQKKDLGVQRKTFLSEKKPNYLQIAKDQAFNGNDYFQNINPFFSLDKHNLLIQEKFETRTERNFEIKKSNDEEENFNYKSIVFPRKSEFSSFKY